ncbi:MAG: hypothetical protein NT157_04515 [Candidatus Micrarchaeota archaeon]|nr:hypothetical protein [Candidatus Micrarchaeota archaeon]
MAQNVGNEPLVYKEVDRQFRATCKAIFGREVGELRDFEDWLSPKDFRLDKRKSKISNAPIFLASKYYPKGAKFCSYEESLSALKFEPLNLNETKDIDSLVSAVRERLYYAGDIVLGNSNFTFAASNIFDSSFIYHSINVTDSKYVAFSDEIRISEAVFGCLIAGIMKNAIRALDAYNDSRCLETYKCFFCNDTYFSHGLTNSTDCIFCFNGKNMTRRIGNMELPREKYSELKKKLMSEFAERLSKEHRLPTLLEIVAESNDGADESLLKKIAGKSPGVPTNKEKIEESFSKTTQLILGTPLSGIDRYADWLSSYAVDESKLAKSAASGKPIRIYRNANFMDFPEDRLLLLEEAEELGRMAKMDKKDVEALNLGRLGQIAYFSPVVSVGNSYNMIECPTVEDSMNCYKCNAAYNDKDCAYSYWPRDSQAIIGSNTVFVSSYCLKCFHSKKLQRCLEVDSSENCSELYFGYNCENVISSIFCFNARNMSCAVGNTPISREKFSQIKVQLQDWLVEKLERDKKLPFSILNLGSGRP